MSSYFQQTSGVFLVKLYKILIICVVKNKHILKQLNCFIKFSGNCVYADMECSTLFQSAAFQSQKPSEGKLAHL